MNEISSLLLLACEVARDQLQWVSDEYGSSSSSQTLEVLSDAISAAEIAKVRKIEPKSIEELSRLLN